MNSYLQKYDAIDSLNLAKLESEAASTNSTVRLLSLLESKDLTIDSLSKSVTKLREELSDALHENEALRDDLQSWINQYHSLDTLTKFKSNQIPSHNTITLSPFNVPTPPSQPTHAHLNQGMDYNDQEPRQQQMYQPKPQSPNNISLIDLDNKSTLDLLGDLLSNQGDKNIVPNIKIASDPLVSYDFTSNSIDISLNRFGLENNDKFIEIGNIDSNKFRDTRNCDPITQSSPQCNSLKTSKIYTSPSKEIIVDTALNSNEKNTDTYGFHWLDVDRLPPMTKKKPAKEKSQYNQNQVKTEREKNKRSISSSTIPSVLLSKENPLASYNTNTRPRLHKHDSITYDIQIASPSNSSSVVNLDDLPPNVRKLVKNLEMERDTLEEELLTRYAELREVQKSVQ